MLPCELNVLVQQLVAQLDAIEFFKQVDAVQLGCSLVRDVRVRCIQDDLRKACRLFPFIDEMVNVGSDA